MHLLHHIWEHSSAFIAQMPKSKRKEYGQFFTTPTAAMFMAELLNIPDQESINILDPGAGSGILATALIEHLQQAKQVKHINLVCYENDRHILELLSSNLQWLQQNCCKELTYRIISDNYIISQRADYNNLLDANPLPDKFDLIIANPPYLKVAKDAPEALAMPDVCHGSPNLYFLFASMSLFNLKQDGEMVYIIPRSWTSGAYFKKFRQKLCTHGVLEHLHLFTSRDKVFAQDSILQETMVLKVKHTTHKPKSICISTSYSSNDFTNTKTFVAPYNTVVNSKDSYIYLITNQQDADTLSTLNKLSETLPSIGLQMKTGLTVDFRHKELLRYHDEEDAIPLFCAQHLRDGKVVFPVSKCLEYLVTPQTSLCQKNTNYLFVKRFTSKEEKRRLQCSVYLASQYPKYQHISTHNKINFICSKQELSAAIIYGLYVLFNSSLYDCYYRILNGSTQVNATEINSMPVPSLKLIEVMGKQIMQLKDMSADTCDQILRSFL